MACDHLAPNGEKSFLFQALSEKFGPDKAHDAWEAVRSQQFLNKYGDWTINRSIDSPIAQQILSFKSKAEFDEAYDRPIENYIWPLLPEDSTGTEDMKLSEIKELISNGAVPVPLDINGEPTIEWVTDKLGLKAEETAKQLSSVITFEEEPTTGYKNRTIKNASADATIAIATDFFSAGEKLTKSSVLNQNKKYIPLDADSFALLLRPDNIKKVVDDLNSVNAKTLNIAGNGIYTMKNVYTQEQIDAFTYKLLKAVTEHPELKNKIESVRTGGQTGFDEAGAKAGMMLGIPTKILAPKGWKYRDKMGIDISNEQGFKARFSSTVANTIIESVPELEVIKPQTYAEIIEGFKDHTPVEFMNRDEEQVILTAKELLIPKLNAEGKPDGYFDPVQQKEIVDSIVSITEKLYRRDPAMKSNAILKAIQYFKSMAVDMTKTGDSKAWIFNSIYDQRMKLTEEALRQLTGLGLYTNEKTVRNILNAVSELRTLTEEEKQQWQANNPDIDYDQVDEASGEFLESTGRISRGWDDNSFELDPKDTASARIKMFMGTLFEMDKGIYAIDKDGVKVENFKPDMAIADKIKLARQVSRKGLWAGDEATSAKVKAMLEKDVPRFATESFLGTAKIADYERTFQETLNQLGNRPQSSSFDDFMTILDSNPSPTIQQMAIELRKADQSMKNEFMTVMMKQYQPFYMVMFNKSKDKKSGDEYYTLMNFLSNRFNQRDTLIKHWQEQQKIGEITKISDAGERVLDINRIKTRWIPILDKARKIEDWSTPESRKFFVDTIGSIFRVSGIDLTDEMMNDLYQNANKWLGDPNVASLFSVNKNGEPAGKIAIFIMKAAGMMNLADDNGINENIKQSQINNPLYTETSTMQGLASLAAKYIPVLYSSNHRNSENKSVWDWGMNTKLSHQFRDFTGNFDQFYTTMQRTYMGKNNWLLNAVKDTPAQLKEMELAYFDGMKPTWGNRGTTRQGQSDREQLLMALSLFQNNGNGFNNKITRVNHLSLTHSDKTMTPIFRNIPHINVGGAAKVPENVLGNIGSLMFNVFKSEYDRILGHADVIFNNAQYEKGKGLFYFLPEFNYDSMAYQVKNGFLSEDEFNLIWPGGQRKLTRVISSDKELKVVNKILSQFTKNLVGNTLSKWKENGIVGNESSMFGKTYYWKLLQQNGIKKEGSLYKTAEGAIIPKQDLNTIISITAAKDYAINAWLSNTALMQLFYGDPAEAFKASKTGTTDMDHVRNTMAEYAKRLAKDIAPRADLYWEGNKRLYNTVTLADVETKESYLKDIAELKKAYFDTTTTSTDAQEITTVQEKLDVLMAAGQIDSKVYTEMSNVITKAGPGGYYEFTIPEHKAVVMQPEKPLYAGTQSEDRGAVLSAYIKSSAYALYPPLTQGKELDKLRMMMETKNIQRANYESAKKLGKPTSPLITFDAQGNFMHPTDEQISVATQQLNRSGFGIQQEVPYEEEKEKIKTLTQMNENIVEGISDIDGFEMPGKELMSGVQIKALKEQVRREMIGYNLNQYNKQLNIDENGTVDPELIFNLLANEAKADTRNSYTLNEIQSLLIRDKDGSLMIPPMFNGAANKFEKTLMAMVNKIPEVKLPGKSFVQASSTGNRFSKEEDLDKSKVIRIGNWDGSPLKTMRIEDGKVLPAQIIMPFNFFDAQGNKLKIEDFLQSGTNLIDHTKLPIELLQGIGGRIPNQKHSSMIPYEVVGFVLENMGDLIFVPAALVKQMGADFDVDKLYSYKRPYTYNKEAKSLEQVLQSNLKDFPENMDNSQGLVIRLKQDAFGPNKLDIYSTSNYVIDFSEGVKDLIGTPNKSGHIFTKEESLRLYPQEQYGKPDAKIHGLMVGRDVYERIKRDFEVVPGTGKRTIEDMQQDYFNIHWSILTHPSMLTRVLAPLDINDLVEESAKLKKPVGSYYNFADPMTQLELFQSGKEAKRLVGATSWGNKFNARIQDKDLRYGKLAEDGKSMEHAFIKVLDEHSGKVKELGLLSGNGTSYYTKVDGAKIDETSTRTKSDNHVMTQSESVDNANKRTLDNLNLTSETYKAVQAFIQLQTDNNWAANSKYWTRLITQPIIWEFSREMKQGNDSLSEKYDPALYASTIQKLYRKYGKDFSEEQWDFTDKIVFSPQRLLEAQASGLAEHQVAALRLFNELYLIGKRMFELEAQFNQDVSGAGANLFTAMEKDRTLQDIDRLPILNAYSIYDGTEVGYTFDATNTTAITVLSQIFPYTSLSSVFDNITNFTGRQQLSTDQQYNILKALRSSTFTKGEHWWKDPQADRVRLIFGDDSLAKRLAIAKRTWGKDNPFLARLNTEIGTNVEAPDYVTFRAAGTLSPLDKQNMSTGWLHILLHTDEEQRRLGEDLMRYAYLSGGVQDANSFVEFVPTSFIAATPFVAMLKDVERQMKDNKDYTNEPLIIQYMQHNPENAIQLTADQFGELPEDQEYPEQFAIPDVESPKFAKYANLVNDNGALYPFTSFRSKAEGKWILYTKTNTGETERYVRIDTLGNQYMDEYNGNAEGGQRSIFIENRTLSENFPSVTTSPLSNAQSMKNIAFEQDGFNKRVSHFEQIGIREGGEKEMIEGLQAIAANPKLPEYLRVVSQFFADSRKSTEYKQAQVMAGAIHSPIEVLSTTEQGMSGQTSFMNKVELNHLAVRDDWEAAETFLHEISHLKLMQMVVFTGYDNESKDSITGQRISDVLTEDIQKYRKMFPEVTKSMDELERIRYEALNAWRNRVGEDRYQQVKRDFDTNDMSMFGDAHRMYYGLSSMHEFVVHATTDARVIEHLNDTDSSRGGTLLSRVWDSIVDLFAAIGKMLGTPVRAQSLLNDALIHVMKLQNMEDLRDVNFKDALLAGKPMITTTEEEAQQLAELGEEIYDRKSYVEKNGNLWTTKLGNRIGRVTPLTGQRGKLLAELNKQLDAVQDAMSRTKVIAERVKLAVKQREIKEDIKGLYQDTNLDNITAIGNKQLAWIDKVLASPVSSAIDVNLAMEMNHTWETLIDIMYGNLKTVVGGVKKEFAELQAAAQERRIELANTKAMQVLTDAYAGIVKLVPMDFKENLTDIDVISAGTLALTRVKPKLVQATAVNGWREANNRDEHIAENTERLQALEKKMKTAGLTDAMMLQYDKDTDQWGLINRLSGSWFSYITDSRSKLISSIEGLDKSTLDVETREVRKKEIWNKYWSNMRENAVFVDNRKFFDFKDGSRLSGPAFDNALQELAGKVGSEPYARELVSKAEQKYQQYLIQRDSYRQHLDTQIDLTPEERNKELAIWLRYNSPVDLLDKVESGKDVAYNSHADEWIVTTPNTRHTAFFDERFQKIEQNQKMKEAFDEYREILTEMVSYLPVEVQNKIPDNFLPVVPKDSASWLATVFGKIRNWDTEMLKTLAATDQEEAMRLRPDKIPVMYVKPFGQTKEIDNRSTDMIRVLELFSMMALQHRYMGNVLDNINIAQGVLKEVNRRRAEGLEEGKPLRHIMDALKYFKDALVFKKPKELEGKVDAAIYSLNPAIQYKLQKEVRDLMTEKEDLNKQIEHEMTEGNFQTDELDAKIDKIDKRLTEIQKDARNIYGSKVIDHLISVNQLKALAFNPFSAISNFSFGAISVSIQARGRVDFNPVTTREAWGIMTHSMKKYWLVNDEGDATAQKVFNIMRRAGVMGDVVDTQYGQSNITTRKHGKLRRIADPFNWQKAGDYFTKGVLTVAMMRTKQIEVTDKDTGEKKTISLWDSLGTDGKLDTSKYKEDTTWYSADKSMQANWDAYRDRIRKVLMMVQGNQDKNSPLMAKKNFLWRLAGQFRMSWFPEGIATRFKAEYYDTNLERDVKGRWRTYGNLGPLVSGMIVCKQLAASLPGVKLDPFAGHKITVKSSTGEKSTELLTESAVDMENMRKNFAGLAWTVGLTTTILMLQGMGDDDEHKKGAKARKRQLLINMLIRNQQDLMLYSSPSVFNTISGNFLPATQVLTDYWNAMKATGHYMFADTKEEKDAFEKWLTKITKAFPYTNLYNKTQTMMTRDLDKLQR